MNDRELLELAAKAAGYRTEHKWNAERLELEPAVASIVVYDGDRLVSTAWNTLANDGAALRLAGKLQMVISISDIMTIVTYDLSSLQFREFHGADQPAATRRAITQCAAHIGSKML